MNRPVGVSVPSSQNQVAGQQATRGQPRTLVSMQEIVTYGVQYVDDNGIMHTALAHKMGDTVYVHPSDEQWAGTIRMASGWLSQAVREKIAEHEALQKFAAGSATPSSKSTIDVSAPKADG